VAEHRHFGPWPNALGFGEWQEVQRGVVKTHHFGLDPMAKLTQHFEVEVADNVQLIQMLLDGLLESLAFATGHIQNNVIEDKSKALVRAGRIVVGLQGALDFERGGELAQNLSVLYVYITRRLFHINACNDLTEPEEVKTLIKDISQALQTLPTLLTDIGRKTH
jgi:flagellar protein FliS